jgi:hypothetical protein
VLDQVSLTARSDAAGTVLAAQTFTHPPGNPQLATWTFSLPFATAGTQTITVAATLGTRTNYTTTTLVSSRTCQSVSACSNWSSSSQSQINYSTQTQVLTKTLAVNVLPGTAPLRTPVIAPLPKR